MPTQQLSLTSEGELYGPLNEISWLKILLFEILAEKAMLQFDP
jgi:hypothetical protein